MAKVVRKQREINFKPNYLFYWMLYRYELAKNRLNPLLANEQYPKGQKVTPVFVNLGGTRSSKTYDEIHLIYKYFTDPENKNLRCIVYRDTLVLCRKYTLIDFKTCFNLMGLIPDVDYTLTGEVSGSPQITIRSNVIDFMGYPEEGKQAGQCHIALINEVLDSDRQDAVENILQRCTMFAMIDANPNKTVHFIYNKEGQFNWFFSKTTYIDNMHLPEGLQGGYESKCPWDFRDSKLMIYDYNPNLPAGWQLDEKGNKIFFNGFRRRVWTKEECPENYVDKPYPDNKYRAPHPTNKAGDRFWWLTMGEGEKASRQGAVFQYKKISEFPYDRCDSVKFGLDFGYSSDPSTLTMVGVNKKELETYIKYLTYQKTPNPILLFDLVAPHLKAEEQRRQIEAGWTFDENGKVLKKGYDYEHIKVACDSSDKFRDEEFVRSLQTICRQKGLKWDFVKVKKPHIVVRISQMKIFKIFVVESDKKIWHDKYGDPAMYEFTNYVYQVINGSQSNIPSEDFNHGIDSAGYCLWYFFKRITDKYVLDEQVNNS